MTRFDYPHCDDPALESFATVAQEFCDLVDRRAVVSRDELLLGVHRLLPLLYVRALALPSTDVLFDTSSEDDDEQPGETVLVDANADRRSHDEWSMLMRELAAIIGPDRYYREVFDPYEPPEEGEVTANLADDIADIYADLRDGLAKWARGESGEALWAWRLGFEGHWGEHATGALRALWARAAWHDLPWPAGSGDAA